MKRRGFTLVELLVALFILGIGVFGVLALWSFAFNITAHSQDKGVAYNIARREIEKAHAAGYMLMVPEGTRTVAYDGRGQETTDEQAQYTVTIVSPPPAVSTELRPMTVTVVLCSTGQVVYETVTYFSRGGV